MTKPLPKRDVEARADRSGKPRLTAVQGKALGSVTDENLRRVLGELLQSTRDNQENFQTIEQWFPIQGGDINSVTGLPFSAAVWADVDEEGNPFRGGEGLLISRESKGVYRILVEEGFPFWTPEQLEEGPPNAEFIVCTPRAASGLQAVASDVEPVHVAGIGSGWIVRLFSNVASSTRVDAPFYFLGANFTDQAGNTIRGPEGAHGPTHKTLYHGEGAPPAELGEEDDFYIDTTKFKIYGPKTKEGWGEGASMVGPQGEPGPQGEEGPQGEPGEAGAPGAPGPAGRAAGLNYKWLTNTEATDPGAGKLKTTAGKTLLRISETDGDGNAIAALIATWDDSSSAKRGQLVVRQVSNPKRFIEFAITGANVDEGAFDKLAVEVIAEGEAIENEAEVRVEFTRTGDKGEEGKEGKEGPEGKGGATEHDKGTEVSVTGKEARPEGFDSVEWRGPAEPENAINGDTWIKL